MSARIAKTSQESANTVNSSGVLETSSSSVSPTSAAEIGGRNVRVPKAVVALALYLAFGAAVTIATLVLPSLEDESCFGIVGTKHHILENAKSPKIIFTGGSNLLFGLDGEKLEKTFNRKVVNMGVCIMFPISYLFEEIKDSIEAGDVVVLSSEYSSFSREYSNPMAVKDILDGYPRAIEWILKCNGCNWDEKGKILIHFRTLGLQKIQYVLSHLRQIAQHRATWSHNKPNAGLEVINARNLNSCGDLTWHLNQAPRKDAVEKKVHIQVPKHIDDDVVAEVKQFDAFCKGRGARVVLVPPPVPYSMYLVSKPEIDSLMDEAKSKLAAPVLGSAQRYSFADDEIFNGHFHLNKAGRTVRTDRLIEDLKDTVPVSGKI